MRFKVNVTKNESRKREVENNYPLIRQTKVRSGAPRSKEYNRQPLDPCRENAPLQNDEIEID